MGDVPIVGVNRYVIAVEEVTIKCTQAGEYRMNCATESFDLQRQRAKSAPVPRPPSLVPRPAVLVSRLASLVPRQAPACPP